MRLTPGAGFASGAVSSGGTPYWPPGNSPWLSASVIKLSIPQQHVEEIVDLLQTER